MSLVPAQEFLSNCKIAENAYRETVESQARALLKTANKKLQNKESWYEKKCTVCVRAHSVRHNHPAFRNVILDAAQRAGYKATLSVEEGYDGVGLLVLELVPLSQD